MKLIENLAMLGEAKRALQFHLGYYDQAMALEDLEKKLKIVLDLYNRAGGDAVPRNIWLKCECVFQLTETGFTIGNLAVFAQEEDPPGAPDPAPKPALRLVSKDGSPL